MKRKTLLWASAGALIVSTLGWAAPDGELPCLYWDIFEKRTLSCVEAPNEETSIYIERAELGGYRLREEFAHQFELIHSETWLHTEGDDAYDAFDPADVSDAFEEWQEYIWSKIISGEQIWSTDTRLNGVSYGHIWTDPGDPREASLVLHQVGNVVWGTLFILEDGVQIDAGMCGSQTVPTSVFPVRAVETSYGPGSPHAPPFHAEGSTQRTVYDGPFDLISNDVTANFWLELDPHTDTVTGEIQLLLEAPCAGDTIHAEFDYNPTSYLYGT